LKGVWHMGSSVYFPPFKWHITANGTNGQLDVGGKKLAFEDGTNFNIPDVNVSASGNISFTITSAGVNLKYSGALVSPRDPIPEYGVYTLAGTITDGGGAFEGAWFAQVIVVP